MVRKLVFTAAAVALAASPTAAHGAAPQERVPAELSGQNERLVGLVWQYVIFPVILAAVLVLLSGGDDEPESP
jgi:hypothetical protein